MMTYPQIDPILFRLGPFALRWYGLAYLGGLGFGLWSLSGVLKKTFGFTSDMVMNFGTYILTGILLGGRMGYVLIYDFQYFLQHPLGIVAIWEGGMSYHGGAIGAAISVLWFARRYQKNAWGLLDVLALGSTIGLGLGRLANFVNGELFGRVSHVPWAMIFPNGGPLPRHPSQLYEAVLEGPVLFLVLWLLRKKNPKPGLIFGAYLLGYGAFRFMTEFVREPDPQVGLFFNAISMGQVLCVTMGIVGALIMVTHYKKEIQ